MDFLLPLMSSPAVGIKNVRMNFQKCRIFMTNKKGHLTPRKKFCGTLRQRYFKPHKTRSVLGKP
jgi:hypothetical protein